MSVQTLAIGDRIGGLKKLFDMLKNPAVMKIIQVIVGMVGGGAGSGLLDAITKIIELIGKPSAQALGDDDLHEQVASICAAHNVPLADLDKVIRDTGCGCP